MAATMPPVDTEAVKELETLSEIVHSFTNPDNLKEGMTESALAVTVVSFSLQSRDANQLYNINFRTWLEW